MFNPHDASIDSIPVRGLSAPWGPLPSAQFAAWTLPATGDAPLDGALPDGAPAADQTPFAEGFASGWAAAEAQLAASHVAQHDAQQNLADALGRLTPVLPSAVAATLKGALLALLTALVGQAATDAELLTARCAELAALVTPDQAAALHLHPDDLPLVAGLAAPIGMVADPTVARGAARLVDGAGSVDAGSAVMLDRLRAHWMIADQANPPC
jgi:flagellar assembly protein FliH